MKNSFDRTRAEGQANLGKVRGGVKRAQILHVGIIAAHNERNQKAMGRAKFAFSRLKTTMIPEKGQRPEGRWTYARRSKGSTLRAYLGVLRSGVR